MYCYQTRIGQFFIEARAGRWHVVFRGESLGSYSSPLMAADDLAGGHTFSIEGNVDTTELGIPADINEWDIVAP